MGVAEFQVLPQIGSGMTFVLSFLAMTPCLVKIWRKPDPREFPAAVLYCTLVSFFFGCVLWSAVVGSSHDAFLLTKASFIPILSNQISCAREGHSDGNNPSSSLCSSQRQASGSGKALFSNSIEHIQPVPIALSPSGVCNQGGKVSFVATVGKLALRCDSKPSTCHETTTGGGTLAFRYCCKVAVSAAIETS